MACIPSTTALSERLQEAGRRLDYDASGVPRGICGRCKAI
jgi:hypothetical protein